MFLPQVGACIVMFFTSGWSMYTDVLTSGWSMYSDVLYLRLEHV